MGTLALFSDQTITVGRLAADFPGRIRWYDPQGREVPANPTNVYASGYGVLFDASDVSMDGSGLIFSGGNDEIPELEIKGLSQELCEELEEKYNCRIVDEDDEEYDVLEEAAGAITLRE